MRTRLSFDYIPRLRERVRSALTSEDLRRLGGRVETAVTPENMRRLGGRMKAAVTSDEMRQLGARMRTGLATDLRRFGADISTAVTVDNIQRFAARMRTRFKFDDVRLVGALVLLLILGFAFIPRADADLTLSPQLQRQNALAGEPAGTAWPVPSDEGLITGMAGAASPPPPTPTAAPTATPAPTSEPTPAVAADGFSAQVVACQAISGGACQGELTSTGGLGSFVALVLLENTVRGDVIEAHLIGPQTFSGGGYTVGGGDGWYYTTFTIGGIPAGAYELVVTRNGEEADRTPLVVG